MSSWRVSTIVLALGLSVLIVGYLRSGMTKSAAPPPFVLADIPMEMGSWSGKEVEILDETVQVLRCHSHINRIYRDTLAHTVTLHMAIWENSETVSPAPHHPEVCYPGAGWSILSRRKITLDTVRGNIPCELILHEKGGTTMVTAHWFMLGNVAFTDSDGFQSQRLEFWGEKSWPTTIKFLMQTPAPSIDAAKVPLKDFAEELMAAVAELEQPPVAAAPVVAEAAQAFGRQEPQITKNHMDR